MLLELFLMNVSGKQQIFAIFNFNLVSGIMRFEKPVPVPKSVQGASKKRKREDSYDGDGNVNMMDYPPYIEDEDNSNYADKVFHLGATEKPTARRPTRRY